MTEEDKILKEINENGFVSFTKDSPQEQIVAKNRLLGSELIQKKSQFSYNFTKEGQIAYDSGGYEKWCKDQKLEKDKKTQITDLTIKQLKGNIFQLKYWWLLLIISGLTGFISANFETILDWF